MRRHHSVDVGLHRKYVVRERVTLQQYEALICMQKGEYEKYEDRQYEYLQFAKHCEYKQDEYKQYEYKQYQTKQHQNGTVQKHTQPV